MKSLKTKLTTTSLTAVALCLAPLAAQLQNEALARERVRALEFIDTVAVVDEFARSIRSGFRHRGSVPTTERSSGASSEV